MENQMMIFKNPAFGEIRTIRDTNNNPWFVGKDVATILGYKDPKRGIYDHVDDEDKRGCEINTPGGRQPLTVINESGLYSLILSSKLPQAKAFKRWVTSEVLPAIRKDGGYIATKKDDTPEEIMARALLIAKSTIDRLEQENMKLSLKAEHLDKVLLCDQCYTTNQIANELGMSVHKLYARLLEMRIVYQQSRQYLLHVDFAGLGLSRNRTLGKDMKDGTYKVFHPYLVWTEKGRMFIHNLINQHITHVKASRAWAFGSFVRTVGL